MRLRCTCIRRELGQVVYIVSCVLSFVDSKAQLRYLRNPSTAVHLVVSVAILLNGVETSPIITTEAIDNDYGYVTQGGYRI